MKIFEKIKALRTEKNITQQFLSDSLSVPRYVISNWEQARSEPDLADISKLADFFECSVDYLLGREDDFGNIVVNTPELPGIEKRLLNAFRVLDDDEKDKIVSDTEYFAVKHGYNAPLKFVKRA